MCVIHRHHKSKPLTPQPHNRSLPLSPNLDNLPPEKEKKASGTYSDRMYSQLPSTVSSKRKSVTTRYGKIGVLVHNLRAGIGIVASLTADTTDPIEGLAVFATQPIVETRRRYGWLKMVFPSARLFRAPIWCPSGGGGTREVGRTVAESLVALFRVGTHEIR